MKLFAFARPKAGKPSGNAAGGDASGGVTRILRQRYLLALLVIACTSLAMMRMANLQIVGFLTMSRAAGEIVELQTSARAAADLGQVLATETGAQALAWTRSDLDRYREEIARRLAGLDALRPQLPIEIGAALEWNQPYHAFLKAIREGVVGDDPVKAGKKIAGIYDYALEAFAERRLKVLVARNEELSHLAGQAINAVGGFMILVVVLLGLFVFRPMERSIRRTIADLNGALRRAEEGDRAKSEFLANMSHEIRTPMNGVMGMAELLGKTALDRRQKMFTDVILKSGRALVTIINDILDFSKIEAGQMELDRSPFDAERAVEDVALLLSARAREKEIELVVRVHPGVSYGVIGDGGRVRQVLTNLVNNAIKFTERGHVLIDLDAAALPDDRMWLKIKVQDTGIGIPAEKQRTIFDKFSQVDGSSTRRHEGTGLGLAIAKRLVELMNGTLSVDSTPGVGSTFTVHLELPADPDARAPASIADMGGRRALVIDDNEVNRMILMEQFSSFGLDVSAAPSGQEGLSMLAHAFAAGRPFDVLALDYQMPGMDGRQVVAAIRSVEAFDGLRIVMLTSIDQALAMKMLREFDIAETLTKPVLLARLRQAVADALRDAIPLPLAPPLAEDAGAEATDVAPPESLDSDETEAPDERAPATLQALAEEMRGALAGPADGASGPGIDILVAEDNPVNQMVVAEILEGVHAFRMVRNGRLAVEAYLARRPALVLMDVSMPEMSGLEATAAIRRLEAEHGWSRVPIVGLTAHALKGDRERCLEAGMDEYLSKPINLKTLLDLVRRLSAGGEDRQAA